MEIWIKYRREWCPFDAATRLTFEDSQLPIRLEVRCDEPETLSLSGGGVWELAPGRLGRLRVDWNPFERADDEEGTQFFTRLTYGLVELRLRHAAEELAVTFCIAPSVLSNDQLQRMRRGVARVAEELLFSWQSGAVAYSRVGLASGRPRSASHLFAQLESYVKPVIPQLCSIARKPDTQMLPQGAVRVDPRRPVTGVAQASIATQENLMVVQAIDHWATLYERCGQFARREVDARHRELESLGPHGANAPRGLTDARRGEIDALSEQERSATARVRELRAAREPFGQLKASSVAMTVNPKVQRRVRYLAVLNAWWQVRKECVVVEDTRLATMPNISAPDLYEYWVFVTLTWMLARLGWKCVDGPNFNMVALDQYALDLRRRQPTVFCKQEEEVHLVYEPLLTRFGRTLRGPRRESQRRLRINTQEQVGRAVAKAYTYRDAVTPDFLIRYVDRSCDRQALIVGDAKYTQVPDRSSHRRWPGARDSIRRKMRKVHDAYAKAVWIVVPEGGAVQALESLGLTFYPGPDASREWFGEDFDSEPFPLAPNDDLSNEAEPMLDAVQTLAHLEGIIDELRECAAQPVARRIRARGQRVLY